MKKSLLLILVTLQVAVSYGQTTYYIAKNGSASNTGISSNEPWSILKLQTELSGLNPGDKVLFKRGDVFNGSLTIDNLTSSKMSPIEFGAFSSGSKPVISRVDTITGLWSVYSGNIYQVTLTASPTDIMYLFADGKKQTLGRYPNSGYLNISAVISTTSLADTDLNEADDFWNGATCVIHTADWALEKREVTDFSNTGSTFTLASTFDYNVSSEFDNSGSGYFFQNSPNCLDQDGEWAYNSTTHVLYYYGNPNGITFTYTLEEDLLKINNSKYLKINDIKFNKGGAWGININNSDYISIDNCEFEYLENGIYSQSSSYDTIKFSLFNNLATNGIEFCELMNSGIYKNTLTNIAHIAGEGNDLNGGDDLKAIHLNALYHSDIYNGCNHVTIDGNLINNIGHSGIHFQMSNNTVIKNNKILNPSQLKADAGGIYAWHNADSSHIPGYINYVRNYDSSVICNNYIETNIFNIDKSWMSTQAGGDTIYQVFGIYIDDGNMRMHVRENVVIGHYDNIFFHNSGHSIIENNITYKARKFEFLGRNNHDANKDTITDTKFIGNKWISFDDGIEGFEKYSIRLLYVLEPGSNNSFDHNYYIRPFNDKGSEIIDSYGYTNTAFFNLAEWKTKFGGANESGTPYYFDETGLNDRNLLVNIFYNFSDLDLELATKFENYYAYFNVEKKQISSMILHPYESIVLFADTASNKIYTSAGAVQKTELVCKVFPVPASDILNVEIDNQRCDEIEIILFDVLGQVVEKKHFSNSNIITSFDIYDLKSIIYFLKISINSEHVVLKKIITL
jgi:parallel beta-helix repeat protein